MEKIKDQIEFMITTNTGRLKSYSENNHFDIIMRHAEAILRLNIENKFLTRTLEIMYHHGEYQGLKDSLEEHEKRLDQDITRSTSVIQNYYSYIELTTHIRLIKELKPRLKQ